LRPAQVRPMRPGRRASQRGRHRETQSYTEPQNQQADPSHRDLVPPCPKVAARSPRESQQIRPQAGIVRLGSLHVWPSPQTNVESTDTVESDYVVYISSQGNQYVPTLYLDLMDG
jgi:hypothetical protein